MPNQLFIQILRKALGQPYQLSFPIDWPAVWNLAKRHHLEAMVYSSNNDSIPDELKDEMSQTYAWTQSRTILQGHYIQAIETALSDNNIPYALQKGSILRNDYPNQFMRFMSDIDFYIRPEYRARIRDCMESVGGVFKGTESGDEQFLFDNRIGVEFHGRLLYRKTDAGIENYPDWSFVDETKNRLTEEGYALNLIGHVVHDLAGGGPGIRYILDLWVYKNRHQPQPDWSIIEERLRTDGINEASRNLLALSEYLFGSREETPLMLEMMEYVLKGGLHGDYKRGIAVEAGKGRGSAIKKQVFRNRVEYENRYPWLQEYPFLLPIAWGLRIRQSVKTHPDIIKSWMKSIIDVSQDEIDIQKLRLKRFGL